jgi:hypothetical protein
MRPIDLVASSGTGTVALSDAACWTDESVPVAGDV